MFFKIKTARFLKQICVVLAVCSVSITSTYAQTSAWVRRGTAGLVYQLDQRGDRILDYSAAGYEEGSEIPVAEDVVDSSRFVNVAPIAGDNRASIQAAIDSVSQLSLNANGFRGVVQLSPGQFDISDTLNINASGVILRGAGNGNDPASDTILRSTSLNPISIIHVDSPQITSIQLRDSGPRNEIIDKVVPGGATSFRVANSDVYSVGEWINVERAPNQVWFDLVTSLFPDDPSGENFGWNTSESRFTFQQERRITRIEGDRVFVHAPLSHNIDRRLGTGTIQRYHEDRISNIGIQRIRGTSIFNASETDEVQGKVVFTDEDHAKDFIFFDAVINAYASDVTGQHLSASAVAVGGLARSVTVQDAAYVEPVSLITGSRRYAFLTDGQFVLQKNLETNQARRAFINNSTFGGFNRGPNVFLNGIATDSFVLSGPHAGYSTGALYDNLTDDYGFEARRAFTPIVHGWRGAHTVIFNSTAPRFQIRNPPESRNFLIGAMGAASVTGDGTVDSFGTQIEFNDSENPINSLYIQQRLQQQRSAGVERREYVIGDFDQFENDGAGSADDAYIDSDWFNVVDNLGGFRQDHMVVGLDRANEIDRSVAFSFRFELSPSEEVVSAVLTLATQRLGTHSDSDQIFLDSLSNSFSPGSRAGWGMEFENGEQVLTLELTEDSFGDLDFLQDGLLNVLVSDDRPVDWAQLTIETQQLPKEPFLLGDSNLDGVVNFLDIALFITRLASGMYQREVDINEDGFVDFLDIQPFILILIGG